MCALLSLLVRINVLGLARSPTTVTAGLSSVPVRARGRQRQAGLFHFSLHSSYSCVKPSTPQYPPACTMSQPPSVAAEKAKSRWDDLPAYEVEHMDYDYIGKCEDLAELRDLYTVLTSGKEGRYFELEKFCEEKMLKLMSPKEKTLWLARTTEPTQEEKDSAASDLLDWAENIGNMDKALSSHAEAEEKTAEKQDDDDGDIFGDEKPVFVNTSRSVSHLPPVRNQVVDTATVAASTGRAPRATTADSDDSDDDEEMDEETRRKKAEAKKLRYSYDYFKEWDKFDVDGELSKLDEEAQAKELKRQANIKEQQRQAKQAEVERKERRERDLRKLGLRGDMLQSMSATKRKVVAEKEKQKGNECFRAKEFEEANMYYSRSLFFDNSNHVVFANRAMTGLRLKKYAQAEDDCTAALAIEPNYIKALSRRGMTRHKRGKYAEAVQDFDAALALDPENRELKKLRASSQRMYRDVGGIASDGTAAPQSEKKKMSRISIVEVDEDEDEEDATAATSFDPAHDFVRADSFAGKRDGFVFKMGDEGLGYYRDAAQGTTTPQKKTSKTAVEIEESDEKSSVTTDSPKSVGSEGYVHLKSPTAKGGYSGLSNEERIAAGLEAKEAGTTAFKQEKLEDAYRFFSRAIDLFPDGNAEVEKCLNNRALVNMRMGRHDEVVRDCTIVLESPNGGENVKALLRRGAAREETGDNQGALDDMCTVMKIDPSRETVSKAISRLLAKIQAAPPAPAATPSTDAGVALKKKGAQQRQQEKDAAAVEKVKALQRAEQKEAAKRRREEEKRAADEIVEKARVKAAKEEAAKEEAAKKQQEYAERAAKKQQEDAERAQPKLDAAKSANDYKNDGNAKFSAGQYADAIVLYDCALRVDRECLAALSNRAMAKLKLGQYESVVDDCTTGLGQVGADSTAMRMKFLYRRACAYKALRSYSAAIADLDIVLAQEPGNKSAAVEKKSVEALAAAPPQNPETLSRIARMKQANDLADAASAKLKGTFVIPTTPPSTFIEFERVRKELQFDLAKFAEYLALIKPKAVKKIFQSSITDEILTTVIKAMASHFIPSKAELTLSFLKYISKLPRFDTTRMFLGDDENQLLRTMFDHLSSMEIKPDTLKTVRKAWKS